MSCLLVLEGEVKGVGVSLLQGAFLLHTATQGNQGARREGAAETGSEGWASQGVRLWGGRTGGPHPPGRSQTLSGVLSLKTVHLWSLQSAGNDVSHPMQLLPTAPGEAQERPGDQRLKLGQVLPLRKCWAFCRSPWNRPDTQEKAG